MLNNLQSSEKAQWVMAYNQTSFAQYLKDEFKKAMAAKQQDMARRIRTQYRRDFINFNRGV